jgi:pimeloyl-ACP methyl ester carboxylesterase
LATGCPTRYSARKTARPGGIFLAKRTLKPRVLARTLPVLLALGVLALAAALWPEPPPRATGAWLHAAGLTPRDATIDGLRVRYVRAGSGPSVLLVHGILSSIFTWRELLPRLARDHDVVALDLPGFGASDQPADLSGELYPAVLLQLMERLAIPRAAIVGHSLGGAAACMFAALHPERVERLVLIAPAGFNFAPQELPLLLRAVEWPPVGELLERLPVRRALLRIGLRQVVFDDALVTDEQVEEYWAPLARPGAVASLRSLLASRHAFAAGFPAQAAQVRAPTLLVWGREDAWIPVANSERFLATIPGSRKVVLDRCGHLPQEEHPQEVLRFLADFLES